MTASTEILHDSRPHPEALVSAHTCTFDLAGYARGDPVADARRARKESDRATYTDKWISGSACRSCLRALQGPMSMDVAKRLLGMEERPKTTCERVEEAMCQHCPAMTWEQRLVGCLGCLLIGMVLEFGSFFRLTHLLMGDPVPFATMYTLGNVVSICSSCFFSGPWAQVKSMFAATRYLATLVYLGTMILTLIFAFSEHLPGRGVLLILCIITQFLAMAYYVLSYIPFARTLVWQWCGACCGLGDNPGL